MTVRSDQKVVILGGGFGGLTVASELGSLAAKGLVEVTLFERNPAFSMGFSMQWVLAGRRNPEEGQRLYKHASAQHVRFEESTVFQIDLVNRQVKAEFSISSFDFLVIALGADPRPDLMPGFLSAAYNLCDLTSVLKLKVTLETFLGGNLVIAVCSTPFKCPPMPYEYAFLIDELLSRQGIRNKTRIIITTPESQPMPVAGKVVGDAIETMLKERNIEFMPNRQPISISHESKSIAYMDGLSLNFDLLCAVPPHRAPQVAIDCGLASPDGFIPVSLEDLSTQIGGVYAIGDVAALTLPNGKPHPKAGIFAEAQARAAACQIISKISGPVAGKYQATGTCFVDVGHNQAAPADADLLAPEGPRIVMSPASAEGLERKRVFESERLSKWFARPRS